MENVIDFIIVDMVVCIQSEGKLSRNLLIQANSYDALKVINNFTNSKKIKVSLYLKLLCKVRYRLTFITYFVTYIFLSIDDSEVRKSNYIEMKGIGNSTTIAFNVEDKETAHKVLLSLCETVGMRLRDSNNCCNVVAVSIRGSDLIFYSRQKKLDTATDSTRKIYEVACTLFDNVWKGNPIRHLGVHITDFCNNDFYQYTLLDSFNYDKDRKLNKVVDEIRLKYGQKAIFRSCFLQSGLSSMCGGVAEEEYPLMNSML